MTIDDIEKIITFLDRMRVEDPTFRVFGSDTHHYCLGSPLSESELKAFEQMHQITLPADFRFFVKYIGNGGTGSPSNRIFSTAGAGPGYGLQRLKEEPIIACDPGKPFPLIQSAELSPVQVSESWGEEVPYPGVLEIFYQGCAFFTYLVVNGPGYGNVWEADVDLRNFYPTGLSFEAWYKRWMDRLTNRALPILANERIVAHIDVGMSKSQVISQFSGQWKQQAFGEKYTFLRFERLATAFELDENDVITRVIRHSI